MGNFISVRRRFTPEEKRRFEAAKEWVKAHQPELKQSAREKFAEMESRFAAMQALKARREAIGMSLGQLAERSGIDKANLSRLENDINTNPTLETLQRIARALGGIVEFTFREVA